MQERFERIFEHAPNYYEVGFPVAIIAGALLKDSLTGNILAQLKLRNIGSKNIVSCKVAVQAFENNGSELEGVDAYSYLDIYATPGIDFGVKNPIFLPDERTRSFKARVTEVVYEDGTVIVAPYSDWKQAEIPRPIEELIGEEELVKQFKVETGDDCCFIPEKKDGLFYCSCGTYSLEANEQCCNCGRSYDELISRLNYESLRENASVRIAKEVEEKAINEKRKALILKWSVVAVACIIVAFAIIKIGVPAIQNVVKYNNAVKLMAQEEFTDATEIFEELGDYKDSKDKITEIQNMQMYKEAEKALQDKKFDEAEKIFIALGSYSDSQDRVKEVQKKRTENTYENANKQYSNGNYAEAYSLYKSLGNYSDAESKTKDSQKKLYEQADSLYSEGKYKEASEKFALLGSYQDAADKAKTADEKNEEKEEKEAIRNAWHDQVLFPSNQSGFFTFNFKWTDDSDAPTVTFNDSSGEHRLSVQEITAKKAVLYDSRGVTHTLTKKSGNNYNWDWYSTSGTTFN